MQLIDDIDSFEPKASKILACGLSPICDHAGFEDGQFCCFGCQNVLFDKEDLLKEERTFFIFRRPLSIGLLDFWFDASGCYPMIAVDCKICGYYLGFVSTRPATDEKTFHIHTRNVYLHVDPSP